MKSIFYTLLAIGLSVGCGTEKSKQEPETNVKPLSAVEQQELLQQAQSLLPALPAAMPGNEGDSPELVALGNELYHDVRLSVNDKQSCNSCHNVDNGGAGVDNEPTSPGTLGERGGRNTPTTLNAGFHFVQFWDGRAADLEAQAKGPIVNSIEMGMKSPKHVEGKFRAIEAYKPSFLSAFPKDKQPVTFNNITKAIAAFERTLVSPSRYDKWVGGDMTALSPQEQRGLQAFINTGCIACHNGTLFGGTMYQKLGLVNAYQTNDAGRYQVTKDPADSLMFKVPSLRNVAETVPYFHDGSVPTLGQAISLMGWHQIGKKLTDAEVSSIQTFLKALTNQGIRSKSIAKK